MMKISSHTPSGAIIKQIMENGTYNISDDLKAELLTKALMMRSASYSPYSEYAVGAAVLTEDDLIFGGCNIENASYGATVCAERTAIFKAVSERCKKIKAIAIAGAPSSISTGENTDHTIPSDIPYAYPCGICRQVINEFAISPDIPVIVCRSVSDYEVNKLSDLLPHSFGPDNL